MNEIVDGVDTTNIAPIPRPFVTRYGADLVFDGRIEYPEKPTIVESEKDLGCVIPFRFVDGIMKAWLRYFTLR
jgi:hypothetical protein